MRRLSYDDHVLLNNYVDHHLFTFAVNSGYPNEVWAYYIRLNLFFKYSGKNFTHVHTNKRAIPNSTARQALILIKPIWLLLVPV